MFWILGAGTVVITNDSLDQLMQIKTGNFTDVHPVINQIFLWIISFGGKSLFSLALIQTFIILTAVYCLLNLLAPSMSRASKIVVLSLLELTPYVGVMGITVWKDIPYTAFTLIGFTFLSTNSSIGITLLQRRMSIFFLSIGSCFRHEGPYYLFIVALFVIIFSRIKNYSTASNKQIMKLLVISGILGIMISSLLVTATRAKPVETNELSKIFLADLAYQYKNDNHSLNFEQKNVVQDVLKGEALNNGAYCGSIGGIVFNSGFNTDAFKAKNIEITKAWLSFAIKHPIKLVYAHACRSAAFLPPLFSSGPSGFWYVLGTAPNNVFLDAKFENLGVFSPIFNNWNNIWLANWRVVAWPGLWLLIALLIIVYSKQFNSKIKMILTAALLSRTLILFCFTPSQDFRYGLIQQYLGILLLISLREKHKKL